MQHFIHAENVKNFRQRLESTDDPVKRRILLQLLEQEEAAYAKSLREASISR